MSPITLNNVPAPVNEVELMRALDHIVSTAVSSPVHVCDREGIARAVTWLHSKYGSVPACAR